MCVHVHSQTHPCTPQHEYMGSEDKQKESARFFLHVGHGDLTQTVRPGGRNIESLCHLTSSTYYRIFFYGRGTLLNHLSSSPT